MNWISIKDRMPPINIGVLVTDGKIITSAKLDSDMLPRIWWDPHGWNGYDIESIFDSEDITHWMPLPPLPIATTDTTGATFRRLICRDGNHHG